MSKELQVLIIPAALDEVPRTGMIPKATHESLAWLYETIGCTNVECIETKWGDIWIDGEGKFAPHWEINGRAGVLARDVLDPSDCVVGDVVLAGPCDSQGNMTPVLPKAIAWFQLSA